MDGKSPLALAPLARRLCAGSAISLVPKTTGVCRSAAFHNNREALFTRHNPRENKTSGDKCAQSESPFQQRAFSLAGLGIESMLNISSLLTENAAKVSLPPIIIV
jgi:hypothetical protein